jgi:hypothetical protein
MFKPKAPAADTRSRMSRLLPPTCQTGKAPWAGFVETLSWKEPSDSGTAAPERVFAARLGTEKESVAGEK